MMVVHQVDYLEDLQEDSLEDLQVDSLEVDLVEVFLEVEVPHDSKLKTEIVNQKQKIKNRKNKRAGIRHCTEDRLAFYDRLSQQGSTAAGAASYDMAKKISGK